MLQNIRDKAQGWFAWIIVGFISVPFALWGIQEYLTPSPNMAVAKINGQELMQKEFSNFYHQRLQMLRAQFGKNEEQFALLEAKLKQDTLQQLISEEILMQTALNSGLRVSDSAVGAYIRSMPYFQENGKFSEKRYQEALSLQGMPRPVFEQQIRRTMVLDQLREGIISSSFLTESQQLAYTQLQQQQRQISYLIIPSARFTAQIAISDQEIEDYFNAHQQDYFTPQKVSVEYVELKQSDLAESEPVEEEVLRQRYEEQKDNLTTEPEWQLSHILIPEKPDPEKARQQAEEILKRAQSGESFEELAKQFSTDLLSKEKGGDLGFLKKGQMAKPVEEAVTAMQAGEIKGVVKSQFGYHILKLLDAKPPHTPAFEEVRQQLAETYQREQAESRFDSLVNEFANLAYEQPTSLDPLAETLKLEKKSTDLFEKSGGSEGLLANPEFVKTAFSEQVLDGQNSEIVQLGEQHIAVLRLKEHQPSKLKTLAEVKEQILTVLRQQKAGESAETLGKTLLEEIKQGKPRQMAAQANNLNWEETRWISRNDPALKNPLLAEESFKLGRPENNEALLKGIKLPNGDYALLAVLGVKTEIQQQTPPAPENQASAYQRSLGSSEFQLFLEALKSQAKIQTYEDRL